MDYYKTLGLETTAGKKDIRTAYRKLALQYHPDRNANDPSAADMMKKINEAYAVLSDDAKKRNYDSMKMKYGEKAYTQFRESYTDHDIFKGSDIRGIFEELARDFGFRDFDNLFSEVYGSGYKAFQFKKNGFSTRGFIFSGPLFKRKQAPNGNQTGSLPSKGGFISSIIHKIGSLGAPRQGKDRHDKISLTLEHATQGGPFAYLVKESGSKLLVKIPPGVRQGQKIRLARMGKPGVHGGPSGDLYLRVSVKKTFLQHLKHLFLVLRSFFGKSS
ncbi:MAG: DnaJ domain-containing protein [Proteobacteria bacterium]|nr:DnaJ domain-containing protein [Pseudomonadota bacterium]